MTQHICLTFMDEIDEAISRKDYLAALEAACKGLGAAEALYLARRRPQRERVGKGRRCQS